MDDTIEIWSPDDLQKTLRSEDEFSQQFENIMNGENL
jgi:MraZ protein